MYDNPAEDWRALTENYRSMEDAQLCELADDFADLTPTAQQVLRDEMKLRGLGDPQAPPASRAPLATGNTARALNCNDSLVIGADSLVDRAAIAFGARVPDLVPDTQDAQENDAPAVEYTWKTFLCECDSYEEALQVRETLKRAGIESWIGGTQSYIDAQNLRIDVAADQLDQARLVLESPIPADIVEHSRIDVPEYELPLCPKCGAADPVLENADPVNSWKCDACGEEWTDPDVEPASLPEDANS